MKIKKFYAKSFADALALIKKEMGDDAVILSSEEKKGLISGVEVTAAVDYEVRDFKRDALRNYSPQMEVKDSSRMTDENPSPSDGIVEMLKGMKEAIEDIKKSGYEINPPECKKRIYDYLREQAIRGDIALNLCEESADIKELGERVSAEIKTFGDMEGKKVIMLIGPTGVGKTTTIAKLSARAVKNRKRVALISLDTYRIGAIEQIRIYSKIVGIPLDVVSGADELNKSLKKYRDKDIIFIDTTGRNPKDASYLEEIRRICNLGIPIQTHLLMSASSDDDFMVDACRHYSTVPVDCIAFTKVDEAVKFGSIYNLSMIFQKPVAYITNGQQVPQDIDFPDSKRLTAMILGTGVTSNK